MRRTRWCASAGLVAVFVLGPASTASAHARLLDSSPAADSVLPSVPTEVVLRFTEPISPAEDAIRLVDGKGRELGLGEITRAQGDTLSASITEALPDGTYAVAWNVVSVDSHPISGAFVFSVGQQDPASSELAQQALSASANDPPNGWWIRLGRSSCYLGIAMVIGSTSVLVLIAPALLESRRCASLLWAGVGLLVAGTALMVTAQAAVIGGSWSDWGSVVDTSSGRWWLGRLIAALVFALSMPFRRRLITGRAARSLGVVVALLVLAVTAAGGHGISGRAVPLGFAATVTHLAAMSTWIGGLATLLFVVPRDLLWPTAGRFSQLGLWSTAALVLSGVTNGWRQIGAVTAFVDSTYGRLLATKAIVFGIVLVVAAAARLTLRSEEASGLPPPANSVRRAQHPQARLAKIVTIEALGALTILGVTSVLVGASPPIGPGSSAAVASATATVGDRVAQVDLLPAVTGGTTMHVSITSPRGGLDRADEILVTAEIPTRGVGPISIATLVAGPNHVTSTNANFPFPGAWIITVIARYGEFDQVVFDVQVEVHSR